MPSAHQPTQPGRPARGWLGAVIALSLASLLLVPGTAAAIPHRLLAESGESTPTPPSEGGAPHERHLRRSGACRVTMSLSSARLTAGEPVTIVGSLACPTPAEAEAQSIGVFAREAGTTGFVEVGTATTEASGDYQFTTQALSTDTTFYVSAAGTRSARGLVRVAPVVTIAGPPSNTQLTALGHHRAASASTANSATFTGTVSPDDGGARVILQRERAGSNEEWRRIGAGEVAIDGTYSISHNFAIAGSVSIRVVVRPRRHNLAGASETVSLEITQRQNPSLTIGASATSLAYGQSVTISGIDGGAANQQVTLQGRSRKGVFQTLTTTQTDGSGTYSFAGQQPAQSTDYKVLDGRKHSARLFVAVAPQLTATPSSTSLVAGGSLVVKGTVAPDHTGQSIYLERQAPSGIGFSVIAVATVGADSTYTLEQAIFTSGSQLFRVKVPSTAESAAGSSELFKVQVDPTSAAALQAQLPQAGSPLSAS